MTHDNNMVLWHPSARWPRTRGERCGAILSHTRVCHSFATVWACGQKAKECFEFLTSGCRPNPCPEITAQLVPAKTHTLVVLIKQNFGLVEADRSAGLAINGIEFHPLCWKNRGE